MGAGPEGHQDLGLFAHQVGQVLVFAGADGAVEQADVDVLVRHGLHVFVLGVHGHRPEEDIGHLIHHEDFFAQFHDGDLAAAAGGGPVQGEFEFFGWGAMSILLACQLAVPVEGAEGANLFRKIPGQLGPFGRFRARDPAPVKPFLLDAELGTAGLPASGMRRKVLKFPLV